jgi:hypothetical protein
VRIGYAETALRARAKRLGAIRRQPQKLREITCRDSKALAIEGRMVQSTDNWICDRRSAASFTPGCRQMNAPTQGREE